MLLHHAGKGDKDGIDSALGTIGIVSKPGTVLDYRPMSNEEGAPRVVKGLKHREGENVRTDGAMSAVWYPDMSRTLVRGLTACTRSASSVPFIRGITTSVSSRSIGCSRAI